MNKLFVYLCYSCILVWMIISDEIVYKLILVTFIIAMTIDELQPRRIIKSKRTGGKK